jgi:hypothetical protein
MSPGVEVCTAINRNEEDLIRKLFYFVGDLTCQVGPVPDCAQVEAHFIVPAVFGQIQEKSI